MKKSVISAVFSVLLLVSTSIGTFAVTPWHPVPNYPMIKVEDGDTVIGTLITSELSEAQKNYMRRWLASPNNICSFNAYYVLFSIVSDVNDDTFFRVESDNSLSIIDNPGLAIMLFDLNTGKFIPNKNDPSSLNINLGYVFSGSYFKSHPPTFTNASIIGYEGSLILRDDDGLFGGEEEPPVSSSEPDTPPDFKPEPPTDPFVPPAPPSFDFGGSTGDLPYDASIWEALMLYLRDTIGSVGTVLLWVLMIIIAIPTVISAIRHFMNQAGGDGNNTSGLI